MTTEFNLMNKFIFSLIKLVAKMIKFNSIVFSLVILSIVFNLISVQNNTTVQLPTVDPNVFRCTFESGYNCTFVPNYNPYNHGLVWKFFKGSDVNNTIDHTLKTPLGHFLALDLYYLKRFGYTTSDKFPISSEYFGPTNQTCVRFSYYMSGVLKNEYFNFWVKKDQMEGVTSNRLWAASGEQGPHWYSHRTTISSPRKWRIGFDINSFTSNEGLIAIDDIIIELDKACPNEGLCDFERKDTCVWESISPNKSQSVPVFRKLQWSTHAVGTKIELDSIKYTDTEWSVQSTGNSSDYLHQLLDHTLNSSAGSYLYLRSQFLPHLGDRAVLVSDHYLIDRDNRSFCLKFFYQFMTQLISSSNTNWRIEVYQSEDYTDVYKIGQIIENNLTDWTEFSVTAKPKNHSSVNMWFYLVGNVGSDISAVAVDDISITLGSCHSDIDPLTSTTPNQVTTPTPCGSTLFRCQISGKCINRTDVCNFHNDCVSNNVPNDVSDEENCGTCSFDTKDKTGNPNMCGWFDTGFGKNNWVVKSVKELADKNEILPSKDANNNTNGHYLIIDTRGPKTGDYPARIMTPVLGATGQECHFQFAYRHASKTGGIATLSVFLHKILPAHSIFKKLLEITEYTDWKTYSVSIGRLEPGYQIEIVGNTTVNDYTVPYLEMELDQTQFVDCYAGE